MVDVQPEVHLREAEPMRPMVHLFGERCANRSFRYCTGVLLIVHLHSSCIIGVVHMG